MVSNQKIGDRVVESSHPTHGRRRETKSPPATIFPPQMANVIARHRIDTSDDLAEETDLGHAAKRQRSTSN